MQLSANGVQPVDAGGAVFAEGLDQVKVIDRLAADHGIQLHELHAVEVAFGLLLVGLPLLAHGLSQGGHGFVIRIGLGGAGQRLFHAGFLCEGVLVLPDGLTGVHAAGGAHGVAAHHRLALQDDHALARVGSGNGGGHACAARAHDDHVAAADLVFDGALVHGHVIGLRVHARGGQGGLDGLKDRVGGDGRAGHRIHGDAAGFRHIGGHQFDGLGAHALGLPRALGGHGGDSPVGQSHSHGHIAAKALGRAGEVAADFSRSGFAQCGAGHHQHNGGQDRKNALFHDGPSSLVKLMIF